LRKYLYSKRYLVSSKERLVLPIEFNSATEALTYSKEHKLNQRGYNIVMNGGDVIRTLGAGRIKEASSIEGEFARGTNGSGMAPQIIRSTLPEPLARQIRIELRKLPAWKLQEAYNKLQGNQTTGVDIIEQNRAHALNAIAEILWERGKLSSSEYRKHRERGNK
jgi:hypothetical protein